MDEIERIVRGILIEKIGILPTQITIDANLVKDLGIDSLDYAEIVLEFEQAFDIKISDEEAEKLETIEEIINFIKAETA